MRCSSAWPSGGRRSRAAAASRSPTTGNIANAELQGGGGAARKAAELQASVTRQKFWLKRKSGDVSHLAWRPAKRYRTSAKWWLYNLDSQLAVSTPFPGLKAFQRRADQPEWADDQSNSWLHLTISCDQGSDNLSAISWMRANSFNLTCIPDWSHGAQNDFYGCLRDLSVYSFWIMCLVVWNVEHGPWQDDLRWQQVGDAWAEATEQFDMQSMPIFSEFLEEVVKENGGSGALLSSSEFDTVEATVWDMMRGGWRPKGYKTNTNKFFATRQKAVSFAKWWHVTLMKYTWLCLESGQVSTKRVANLNIKAPPPEQGDRATTSSNRPDFAERALRGSAQNAMVLACLILGERRNCRLTRVICLATGPLHEWHSKQNKAQRSSKECLVWLVSQASGEFVQSLSQTLMCWDTCRA